jgi:hypothetical protein
LRPCNRRDRQQNAKDNFHRRLSPRHSQATCQHTPAMRNANVTRAIPLSTG